MTSRFEVLQWVSQLRREAAGNQSHVQLTPEQALILASILVELSPPAIVDVPKTEPNDVICTKEELFRFRIAEGDLVDKSNVVLVMRNGIEIFKIGEVPPVPQAPQDVHLPKLIQREAPRGSR